MALGVRSKLLVLSLGLIVLSLVAAELVLSRSLEGMVTSRIEDDVAVRLQLIERAASSAAASDGDLDAWDRLADDLGARAAGRVTLIGRDGTVLGDSEVPRGDLAHVGNHADRPEVRAALLTGRGSARRTSDTVKQQMMYAAVPFSRGGAVAGVARLAVPLTEVDAAIASLRRVLLGAGLLALLVALVTALVASQLASRTVRRLTDTARRMAEGDLEVRARVEGTDELSTLGRALDRLAASLSEALGSVRGERDLLDGVLGGMREGVLLTDDGGRVLMANQSFRAMALDGRDPVGRPLVESARSAELNEALADGAPTTSEVELPGPDARRLLVHASKVAAGRLAVVVDVTDLRRLELYRKDFVANVSHELRTPLTSVRSAVETLQTSARGDPEALDLFLGTIARNAERLHRLIEDILDLSRLDARQYPVSPEPVALGSIVAQVLEAFRGAVEAKHVRLGAESPDTAALVDRRAIVHVLSNLVDNAVKYSPEGAEVTVQIAAEPTCVRLSVVDTGPGIEARHLPRLFERFYRVDAGRSRDLGGTGLGLAIVKHLVEAQGGSVSVESAVGRGSAFHVRLRASSAR